MTVTTQHPQLTIVGRSTGGRPRTYRVAPTVAREAAYHRLTAHILRLDVASLTADLRQARLGSMNLPAAA